MQNKLKRTPRDSAVKLGQTQHGGKRGPGSFEGKSRKNRSGNANFEMTPPSSLKLFPGTSFSMMFRFLVVSKIYRYRMALFCRKNYGLEPNLLLILTAASEGHVQQGILARSLGINKNAMVFLVDDLGLRGLIKRVENPDNRRERFIECTHEGRQIVVEIKRNYPEIVRWGLYPLTDAQIAQFGDLLSQIIESESKEIPPLPLFHSKKR